VDQLVAWWRTASASGAQVLASANDTTATPLPLTWGVLLERARQVDPEADPAFADDLDSAHRELNQPVRDPWSGTAPEPHG